MTNGEHAKQIDAFDPLGSIFLPRTNNPEAEFSVWQAQILLRRGVATDASFEEQCRLQEELDHVRRYYLGAVALHEVK